MLDFQRGEVHGYPDEEIYFYKAIAESEAERLREISDLLDILSEKGFAPRLLRIIHEGDRIIAKFQRLQGLTLQKIVKSDEHRDYVYTLHFARRLAELILAIYEVGLYQEDFHFGNIMYVPDKDRCVVVDLESMVRRSEDEHPLRVYVSDYCEILVSTWLGENLLAVLEDLDDQGRLIPLLPEEVGPRFLAEKRRNPHDVGLYLRYSHHVIDALLEEKGIQIQSIPERVHKFVLRGLDPDNVPHNFDYILTDS